MVKNPDYRLGQLITVATKPSEPHPSTFYIEDDIMLEKLKSLAEEKKSTPTEDIDTPYWKKYSDLCRIKPEEVSMELIEDMLNTLKPDGKNSVITPIKLMELSGAPVSDEKWLNNQGLRVNRIRKLLEELHVKNVIKPVEIGYEIVD